MFKKRKWGLVGVLASVLIMSACGSEKVNQSYQKPEENKTVSVTVENRNETEAFNSTIENVLKDAHLSFASFNEVRLKPINSLASEEVEKIKKIRRSVPTITKDTMMQKVLPPSAKEWLFKEPPNGEQIKIGGFVAKVSDTKTLNNYDKIVEGLRLDYEGTPEWPNEYLTSSSALAIRYKATVPDNFKIPFGGQNKEEATKMLNGDTSIDFMDVEQKEPFTGNGFTKSKNYVIPEFINKDKLDLHESAELYEINKNGEKLIAVYSEEGKKFISVIK
ncbi:hypothetical protein [Bacillus gaemokensis]|uniref:Lipoprotein n=1 Tax=Bacillus gaemokensis TaxID=574375 RepID=A0A073KDV1_9BACI|nr:hypothetical protein [Bacillus gaemokensis]KEK24770.1 hypothetical protein BAGA_24280 [Bacillus gaemokensis]KYG34595.1 hypothetical protein AZF08_09385 [Bacillus gaemokensis]